MIKHTSKAFFTAVMVAAASLYSVAAHADAVADFYKGKDITIAVGYSPGGSYDTYARMLSDVLSKHIPGNPNIIVQNMPGSGGKKLANYLYNVAPTDGTYFGFLADAFVVSQMLQPKKVKYDPSKFVPIGSITPVNPVTMVGRNSPAKTVEEARKNQFATACTGKGSQSFIMPAMMKYFLDFKVKIICGYKGSAPGTLALERGEVDAQSSAWASWRIRHKDQIADGTFTPIVQVGLVRESELPNVPLMQDLTDNSKHKQVLKFVSSGAGIGRSMTAPPGVAADRIAAIRKAFNAAVKDADFLAAAAKRNSVVNPVTGEELEMIIANVLATPDDLVELAREAIQTKTVKCEKNCKKP